MPDDPQTSRSAFPVVLPADPVTDPQAATKRYVDDRDDLKVDRAGDTMLGPLFLARHPVEPMEAATRGYVDGAILPHARDVPSDPVGGISATNVQAALAELDMEKVDLAGDAMLGPLLTHSPSPIQDQEAVPKVYADTMGSLEFRFLPGDWTPDAGTSEYFVQILHQLNRRPKVTMYTDFGDEVRANVSYSVAGVNFLEIRVKLNLSLRVLLT
jgi:hypothetical protein